MIPPPYRASRALAALILVLVVSGVVLALTQPGDLGTQGDEASEASSEPTTSSSRAASTVTTSGTTSSTTSTTVQATTTTTTSTTSTTTPGGGEPTQVNGATADRLPFTGGESALGAIGVLATLALAARRLSAVRGAAA